MDLTRQQDLININTLSNLRVMILGVGGIGSFAAMALAKMGVKHIEVWDRDELEGHNIPNQNYGPGQVGQIKVNALRANILEATGEMVSIQNKFFTLETMDFSFNPDLIVCAVDSMAVRELLWHLTVKHAPSVKWYVDTRMASRSLSVFVANLQDSDSCKQYENSIFPDAEAVQERCTAKAIIHTAYAAAYTVGNIVHDIVNNVPVYQAYHAELDKFRFVKSKAIININSQPQEEN